MLIRMLFDDGVSSSNIIVILGLFIACWYKSLQFCISSRCTKINCLGVSLSRSPLESGDAVELVEHTDEIGNIHL